MSIIKNKLNQLYGIENVGLVILNSNYCIENCNYSFRKLFGYSHNEIINQSFEIILKSRNNNIFKDIFSELNISNEKNINKKNIEASHKDKSIITIDLSLSTCSLKNQILYLLLIHDKSKLKDAIVDISNIAYYDALTNIPNRRLFFDRFDVAIKQANRLHHKLGILYIDIDGFKHINDTMGHEAGDVLLVEFSERLKSCIRDSDTVARIGGDEFAILMLNVESNSSISILINRILNKNHSSISVGNDTVKISCSIGMSMYPDSGEKIKTLLRKADLDMYKTKKS